VPNARDADQPALEMLDAILSSGKNARLYRALVDKGFALMRVRARILHYDLSLHVLSASLAPGSTHEQVEEALGEEIAKIKTDGVTPAEIARVKQQYIACRCVQTRRYGGGRERTQRMDRVGDWTLYVTFPQKVQQVTPATCSGRKTISQ